MNDLKCHGGKSNGAGAEQWGRRPSEEEGGPEDIWGKGTQHRGPAAEEQGQETWCHGWGGEVDRGSAQARRAQ